MTILNVSVTRSSDEFVRVNLDDMLSRVQPGGILFTTDEASHLRVMLGDALGES